MNCPNCKNKMEQVKTPSANLGLFVQFLQCPNCGGLWFDRFDLAQIPQNEAFKIDSLNEEKLKAIIPLTKDLFCPKDNEPLAEIKDYGIPENSQIYRCHKCEGIWLNKGELSEYKQGVLERQKEAEEFENKFEDEESDREAEQEKERVMSQIGGQLMPLPPDLSLRFAGGNEEQPFVLSSAALDLLKEVPQDQKMAIINQMANEHNERVDRETRFINITMTVLNIIYRLLLRG